METAWGGGGGVGTEGVIMAWLDSGHTHIYVIHGVSHLQNSRRFGWLATS